jgi:predicted TIM-barrel fold metal-dependent hydrolase
VRRLGTILFIITTSGALAQPGSISISTYFTPGWNGDGDDLVAHVDTAGNRRALVLSVAYQFANPDRATVQDEYARVRPEKDWTSAQVARYPTGCGGFCGFNPLRDYATRELERCAQDPRRRNGIKLHFGNSDVDSDNSEHVKRLRQVFQEANLRGMAIVVHMRSSVTRERPYGAKEAGVFLHELLRAAPHVPVQIAHLCGAGGYDDPSINAALAVFIDAIAHHDWRMAHVCFEISGVTGIGKWQERWGLIAARVRQLGLDRVLFGPTARFLGTARASTGRDFGNCCLRKQNSGRSKQISLRT